MHDRPLRSRLELLEKHQGGEMSATAVFLREMIGDSHCSPEDIAEGMQLLEASRRYMDELMGRSNGNPTKPTR